MTGNLSVILEMLWYHFFNMLAILRNLHVVLPGGYVVSWYVVLMCFFVFSIILIPMVSIVRYRKNEIESSIEGRRGR